MIRLLGLIDDSVFEIGDGKQSGASEKELLTKETTR